MRRNKYGRWWNVKGRFTIRTMTHDAAFSVGGALGEGQLEGLNDKELIRTCE